MEAQGWQGFWEQFSMTKGIKINLFYWKEEIVQLKCWWWWRESNKCKGKFKEGEQSKQTKWIERNLAGGQCKSAWSACSCSKSRCGRVRRGRWCVSGGLPVEEEPGGKQLSWRLKWLAWPEESSWLISWIHLIHTSRMKIQGGSLI